MKPLASSKQSAFPRTTAGLMLVAGLITFAPTTPAAATGLSQGASALIDISDDTLFTEARAGRAGGARAGAARAGGARAVRTTTVHRGGATVRRSTTVGRAGVVGAGAVGAGAVGVGAARAGAVRTGAWARPGSYYWPRGGAIAAGAAIGMVSAATAAAWAGAAPAPGMCWYYTDPSRQQGFWDYCR
jgi:hypothetical protein